jgi:hypothetical protein
MLGGSSVVVRTADGRTDRQADMSKLILGRIFVTFFFEPLTKHEKHPKATDCEVQCQFKCTVSFRFDLRVTFRDGRALKKMSMHTNIYFE